jgi:hypothetical protein
VEDDEVVALVGAVQAEDETVYRTRLAAGSVLTIGPLGHRGCELRDGHEDAPAPALDAEPDPADGELQRYQPSREPAAIEIVEGNRESDPAGGVLERLVP